MENHLWHFWLLTRSRSRRRPHILRPRRTESPTQKYQRSKRNQAPSVTFEVVSHQRHALVRPESIIVRLERKYRPRSKFLFWCKYSQSVFAQIWFWPYLSLTSSGVGGVLVFQRSEAMGLFSKLAKTWFAVFSSSRASFTRISLKKLEGRWLQFPNRKRTFLQ